MSQARTKMCTSRTTEYLIRSYIAQELTSICTTESCIKSSKIRAQKLKKTNLTNDKEFSCSEIKKSINFGRTHFKKINQGSLIKDRGTARQLNFVKKKAELSGKGHTECFEASQFNGQNMNFPSSSLITRRRRVKIKTQNKSTEVGKEEVLFKPINDPIKFALPVKVLPFKETKQPMREEKKIKMLNKKTDMVFFKTLSILKSQKRSTRHVIKIQIDQTEMQRNMKQNLRESFMPKNRKAALLLRRKPVNPYAIS
ncbi:unnamed protein product [Moneuplotes crassus]|uniref:Uncharacterized protein n=1 Tax=Euplotes crassus TaxID=5936 RepID=A0AAD1Y7W1_EUPCR|nr:unnamed protein product [Moneuplotes crassus]